MEECCFLDEERGLQEKRLYNTLKKKKKDHISTKDLYFMFYERNMINHSKWTMQVRAELCWLETAASCWIKSERTPHKPNGWSDETNYPVYGVCGNGQGSPQSTLGSLFAPRRTAIIWTLFVAITTLSVTVACHRSPSAHNHWAFTTLLFHDSALVFFRFVIWRNS